GRMLVAYFCAEYAIHESLQQYSGGLGVLAGDHIKSCSDLGVPLVGIGLLYRCGYYTQEFATDGSTRVIYPELDFSDLPITDTGKSIRLPIGRRTVQAKIWKQTVGRNSIYTLDTDVPANHPEDRRLTRHLYGGDREYRIRQEILLGVGGVLALEALGLRATVFHLNEGHAAFAALERVARLMAEGSDRAEAIERVRTTSVFTTHTPVPAGNDRFDPRLTLQYIGHYAKRLGVDAEELLGLGREDPTDRNEPFCMTVLALKLSARCNGVAALHGDTSRRMWTRVYGLPPDQHARVPIGHVTNGIHSRTWLAPEMLPLYQKYLKPRWNGAGPTTDFWKRAATIPDAELWALRNLLRQKLIHFIRQRLADQIARAHGDIQMLMAAHQTFDPHALTIGFARRFATYKRAPLIFHDAARLARILGRPQKPVQIVFAGKAHPADSGGQAFAQQIYQHAQEHRFVGRVVILEDYDMHVGRMLTSGVDVWLNNPLRPQEASGTSGMKPPLHGGLNLSILDGWWPEAYNGHNGWAIGGKQFADPQKQDAYDASSLYDLLENQVVPRFYERDRSGLPRKWIAMMKESMRTVCHRFSTARMVGEYATKYYLVAR
ncbi:MAG: alpha-glucan family phosphorylase, partial [Phycisphaerae bacterium]|nr:alpha-glucan family phosphorylase [Phycisphaerae bacterium]